MAKLLYTIMLLCIFATTMTTASAAELGLGIWQASGSQTWRIAFPPDGASQLYYPLSGRYVTGSYENKITGKTTLHIDAGYMAALTPATGSDSDWDYSRQSELWYYGEFKTTGGSGFLNIDFGKKIGANSGLYYGYTYNRSVYRMNEGYYYRENYLVQNPPQALGDLASTYSLTYQGPHIRLCGTQPFSAKTKMTWSLAFSPLILAQGHGWWNLRNLNFTHTGLARMWDASVGINFTPGANKPSLSIGYRYQYFGIHTGAEDTATDVSWKKAEKIQKGFYAFSEFRF